MATATHPEFGGQGMYGLAVHRAVLAARQEKTGASVHLVDEELRLGRGRRQVRGAGGGRRHA